VSGSKPIRRWHHWLEIDLGRGWVVVALILIGFLAVGWVVRSALPRPEGPVLEATVRVQKVIGGHRGKFGASYRYEILFPDGELGVVTLRDMYSRGTVLRLRYSRTDRGGYLVVHGYGPGVLSRAAGKE
jgi:hypothetical protein